MAFAECENGHIYDSAQYTACPYCNNKEVRIEFTKAPDAIGKTVPVSGAEPIGKTVPVSNAEPVGKTVPVSNAEPIGKTVPVTSTSSDLKPVYAWLVSTDGADMGKDYRITSGNCLVGTTADADITIAIPNDPYEGPLFRICYDSRGGEFYLVPNNIYTKIYVSNEPIFSQKKITSHTVIDVGGKKLAFIPFCTVGFNWP